MHCLNGTAERQQWLWHRRLGHPSLGYLKLLFPVLFSDLNKFPPCETCLLSKSHRNTYKSSVSRENKIFSLVHSDVWGPAPVSSSGSGLRYFLLFIDDCSRMSWVYLLKNKSEVASKLVEFYNMVQNQFGVSIRMFRSDNGGNM